MTHACWTYVDSSAVWWSLRSDETLWTTVQNPLTGGWSAWTQDTTAAHISAALWSMALAAPVTGYVIAAAESTVPAPPPPPQVT